VKLRGYISQGLLAPLSVLPVTASAVGGDVTELLGITKYEEPIPIHMAGQVIAEAPGMLRYTDIENIKNYPDIFAPSDTVVITEKIHGTNFRAYKLDGKLFVGSHRLNLVRDEMNLYWRGALKLKLDETLQEGEEVFGEVFGLGVQDLAYGRKQNEIDVAVFDMVRGGRFLDYADLETVCVDRDWMLAPFVYWGSFDKFKMPEKSFLAKEQIIEGVVIRPEREEFSERLQGRRILKSLSDEYLLRKDGTERH
jgi:RNA ligase (TIGR02306 family)